MKLGDGFEGPPGASCRNRYCNAPSQDGGRAVLLSVPPAKRRWEEIAAERVLLGGRSQQPHLYVWDIKADQTSRVNNLPGRALESQLSAGGGALSVSRR